MLALPRVSNTLLPASAQKDLLPFNTILCFPFIFHDYLTLLVAGGTVGLGLISTSRRFPVSILLSPTLSPVRFAIPAAGWHSVSPKPPNNFLINQKYHIQSYLLRCTQSVGRRNKSMVRRFATAIARPPGHLIALDCRPSRRILSMVVYWDQRPLWMAAIRWPLVRSKFSRIMGVD
jgi:hypothetical protein